MLLDTLRSLCQSLIGDQNRVVLIVQEDGTLLSASDLAREFFDLKTKVLGRRVDALLPPQAKEAVEKCLANKEKRVLRLPWQEALMSSQRAASELLLSLTPITIDETNLLIVTVEIGVSAAKRHSDVIAIQDALGKLFDPLTIIRGYCEHLQPLQTQGKPALLQIERSAIKLTDQITAIRRSLNGLLNSESK